MQRSLRRIGGTTSERENSEDSEDNLSKPRHARNALFTLVLLFVGVVAFALLMTPDEDSSPASKLRGPIDRIIEDLVDIERPEVVKNGKEIDIVLEKSIYITDKKEAPAALVANTEVKNLTGCLRTVPQDNGPHIVTPPAGHVTLVCCQSTKGPMTIAVHKTWAPLGAQRFLDMVTSGFFSSKVGLFRALKGFIIQFGLAGQPSLHKIWHKMGNLADDPSWLPLGPSGREINGVKRFQKGYFAYAGAGKNSRGTQLIVAFEANAYLGGGSPWEVPWGQLVGQTSFDSLANVYTGYGEKVSQGKIMNRGNAYLEDEFPLLDYITECAVTDEDLPWRYINDSIII